MKTFKIKQVVTFYADVEADTEEEAEDLGYALMYADWDSSEGSDIEVVGE